jgi:hypothetical protein
LRTDEFKVSLPKEDYYHRNSRKRRLPDFRNCHVDTYYIRFFGLSVYLLRQNLAKNAVNLFSNHIEHKTPYVKKINSKNKLK